MSLVVFARAPDSFKAPLTSSRAIWKTRTRHLASIFSFPRSEEMRGRQMLVSASYSGILNTDEAHRQRDYTDGQLPELIDVIIKNKASLFVSAVGVPPQWAVDKLHAAGIPVMK